MKIAILGYGFVGRATEYFLTTHCSQTVDEVVVQDPAQNLFISDWSNVDYTIVCVPTDLNGNKLSTNVLAEAMRHARGTVIVRSTVGVDQVSSIRMSTLQEVILWPEFLREKHWKEDTDRMGKSWNHPIILGGNAGQFWFDVLHDFNVVNMTIHEAALCKMSRNAMLAMKVAQSNVLYDLCEEWGCDMNKVTDFLQRDGQLGQGHFQVPGPDGDRGFGGKCFPKDTTHYSSLIGEDNIYEKALQYNETIRLRK